VGALAAGIGPRTRVAVLDHVTSATALVFPVAELVALCRSRGVPVLVDGAHAPGMLDLDLPALGADWYTGNCHKWLCAAKGCAFLWANPERPEARADLHPAVISHHLGQPFPREFDWIGTRDFSAWLSVDEALAFHGDLGGPSLRAHNRALLREGAGILAAAWGCALQAPAPMLGSMATLPSPVAFEPEPEAAVAFGRAIWERHRIECMPLAWGGRPWIRVTAQAYNDSRDYERLAQALRHWS